MVTRQCWWRLEKITCAGAGANDRLIRRNGIISVSRAAVTVNGVSAAPKWIDFVLSVLLLQAEWMLNAELFYFEKGCNSIMSISPKIRTRGGGVQNQGIFNKVLHGWSLSQEKLWLMLQLVGFRRKAKDVFVPVTSSPTELGLNRSHAFCLCLSFPHPSSRRLPHPPVTSFLGHVVSNYIFSSSKLHEFAADSRSSQNLEYSAHHCLSITALC